MRKKTKSGRILMVGILIAALWSPATWAGADSAPDQFEAVLGPFPIADNPCTGASGITLTAHVDVTFHLFTDQAGHDHFISVWNGTAVTSDGFSGPIQLTNIGQPDAKDFSFRGSAQLTDGTDSYVIVLRSTGFIVDKCITPPAPELIFAVAYTDVDTNDGGYNPTVDRLIAKLVDDNNDGVLSAGDVVMTGEYPKDFEATTFGQFVVQQHTVITVVSQSPEFCRVESDSGTFDWNHQDQFLESYIEMALPQPDPIPSAITDGFETAAGDHMSLDARSPSQPTDTFSISGLVFTDQAFIDIELNCH